MLVTTWILRKRQFIVSDFHSAKHALIEHGLLAWMAGGISSDDEHTHSTLQKRYSLTQQH